ncbi:MAG: hypothetical protein Q9209_000647 [Squamulea sp. 1 TL-2023]
MPPPESEWMLWAMRLKTSVRVELDQEVQSVHTRCAKLEQDATMLDVLKKDVKNLAASYEHLQNSSSGLQNRILEVESGSITRDQNYAIESDILREAARLLAEQLKGVVEGFEEFKRESKARQETQQREQQELREQIIGLMSKIHAEDQKEAGRFDLIDISKPKASFADPMPARKTFPEATTIDDVPDEAVDQPQSFRVPQHSDLSITQGKATYQEYLATGESFVEKAIHQAEAQAVKAYIQGMRQRFRRKPVWDTLEAKGWTWANAKHEMQRIIDEGRRRRQSRRTIQLPPLGEFD